MFSKETRKKASQGPFSFHSFCGWWLRCTADLWLTASRDTRSYSTFKPSFLFQVTLPSHFVSIPGGRLSERVQNHTKKFIGQRRVTELAVLETNLDLFGDVKDSPEFFSCFVDDLATKQRDMELKQGEEQVIFWGSKLDRQIRVVVMETCFKEALRNIH